MFGGTGEERGMIPRSVEYLFDQVERRSKDKNIAVVASFLEMYCDRIRDLGKSYLDKSSAKAGQITSEW